MSKTVAPVPRGFKTVTTCLTVRGVDQAIEFYAAAFDAKVQKSVCSPGTGWSAYAEIKIGTSVVILIQEQPALGMVSPLPASGTATHGHLYVKDVDAFFTTAIKNGAHEVMPIRDMYWGDRMATITDPFGHIWTIASRVENLRKEEIEKRALDALDVVNEDEPHAELAA